MAKCSLNSEMRRRCIDGSSQDASPVIFCDWPFMKDAASTVVSPTWCEALQYLQPDTPVCRKVGVSPTECHFAALPYLWDGTCTNMYDDAEEEDKEGRGEVVMMVVDAYSA